MKNAITDSIKETLTIRRFPSANLWNKFAGMAKTKGVSVGNLLAEAITQFIKGGGK